MTAFLAGDGTNLTVTANPWILAVKGLCISSIILGAIVGNLLVILSVIRFERLRTVITNCFVVSVALADLLVAVLVIPFNASMELNDGRWLFFRFMCDFFNGNDVLFSSASILHLCCIAVDRYIAILNPLMYQSKMTKTRVALMLSVTWIASSFVSHLPVHTQIYTTDEHLAVWLRKNSSERCVFEVNKIYAGISSSVSFGIPCSIMVFVYAKIFGEARKQERSMQSSVLHVKRFETRLAQTTNEDQNVAINGKHSVHLDLRRSGRRQLKQGRVPCFSCLLPSTSQHQQHYRIWLQPKDTTSTYHCCGTRHEQSIRHSEHTHSH